MYSLSQSQFTSDTAWADSLPYATVVVESLEGVRFVGTCSGPETDLMIGLTVNMRAERIDENFAYIWFDPILAVVKENGG